MSITSIAETFLQKHPKMKAMVLGIIAMGAVANTVHGSSGDDKRNLAKHGPVLENSDPEVDRIARVNERMLEGYAVLEPKLRELMEISNGGDPAAIASNLTRIKELASDFQECFDEQVDNVIFSLDGNADPAIVEENPIVRTAEAAAESMERAIARHDIDGLSSALAKLNAAYREADHAYEQSYGYRHFG